MAKAESLQGSIDLLVLKILSRRSRLHGYAIMTAIQNISRRGAARGGGVAVPGAAPHGGGPLDPRRMDHQGERVGGHASMN